MMQPLDGFRVLDLTNVLAGPFCCHQLAHLGADVIKIEKPGTGDLARQLGADPDLNAGLMGVSFLAQNTGKRSITVDLKSPRGREVVHRLISTADVLVENFRPGVMERLGIGYDALRETNADLVYCAISGFGQSGPLSRSPAYDQIVQGLSGVMSVTGFAETAPTRVGYPVADTIGGLTAAFAITSALARPAPGRGTFIDVAMLDSVLATMGWVVSNYLIAGQMPHPMGNDNFTASPSGSFRTSDGLINIAANKQEQFAALCQVVGRPDLLDDPRFAGRQARLDNRHLLSEMLEDALQLQPSDHWVDALNTVGVPAGPVLSVPEILAHPQVTGRDLLGTFDAVPGVGRAVRVARTGIRLDGESPSTHAPPPVLGADTDAILTELGYSRDEIAALHRSNSV